MKDKEYARKDFIMENIPHSITEVKSTDSLGNQYDYWAEVYAYYVGEDSPFAVRDDVNSSGYTWDITGLIEDVLNVDETIGQLWLLDLINKDFPNHLQNQLKGLDSRYEELLKCKTLKQEILEEKISEYFSQRSYYESLIGGMELVLGKARYYG